MAATIIISILTGILASLLANYFSPGLFGMIAAGRRIGISQEIDLWEKAMSRPHMFVMVGILRSAMVITTFVMWGIVILAAIATKQSLPHLFLEILYAFTAFVAIFGLYLAASLFLFVRNVLAAESHIEKLKRRHSKLTADPPGAQTVPGASGPQ